LGFTKINPLINFPGGSRSPLYKRANGTKYENAIEVNRMNEQIGNGERRADSEAKRMSKVSEKSRERLR
jgi:hypothetical protein